jgi:hypothetical protein
VNLFRLLILTSHEPTTSIWAGRSGGPDAAYMGRMSSRRQAKIEPVYVLDLVWAWARLLSNSYVTTEKGTRIDVIRVTTFFFSELAYKLIKDRLKNIKRLIIRGNQQGLHYFQLLTRIAFLLINPLTSTARVIRN